MSRFVTQDRIKITVSSMPGSWDSRSGAEAERENVKLRPGAGEPKQVVHTQLEYGDVTVTRLFDADTDAALLAEFKETYRNCAGYATRSYRDVGESIAKSPAELRTKWLATQQIEAMHRKALVEKRNAAAELEAQQRATIIEELKNGPGLEPGIECEILGLDPTDPKRQTRSADGPMSLADLTALRNSLMGAAQVLTRTAALTPAATATETDEALKQPAPPARPDASGKVEGVDPKVMEALRAGARSAGLNLDNALAAARRMS